MFIKFNKVLDTSWTLGGDKKKEVVKWIAFFGDCDHWIEPVTSGYRVTLTYHLFASMKVTSTSSVVTEPIYSLLREKMVTNQKPGTLLFLLLLFSFPACLSYHFLTQIIKEKNMDFF